MRRREGWGRFWLAVIVIVVTFLAMVWIRDAARLPTDGETDAGLRDLISALAAEPTRPLEGRLTRGFPYAPWRAAREPAGR